jgi:hypothetical protein
MLHMLALEDAAAAARTDILAVAVIVLGLGLVVAYSQRSLAKADTRAVSASQGGLFMVRAIDPCRVLLWLSYSSQDEKDAWSLHAC